MQPQPILPLKTMKNQPTGEHPPPVSRLLGKGQPKKRVSRRREEKEAFIDESRKSK